MLKRKVRAIKKKLAAMKNEQIYHARKIYKMCQTISDLKKTFADLKRMVEARPAHTQTQWKVSVSH
jgi:hypothetical protein